MAKAKQKSAAKRPGVPAKINQKAAAQRRKVLRAHYAAKYRSG